MNNECHEHFLLADHGKEHHDGQQKKPHKKPGADEKSRPQPGFF